jgi:crotonobetainyl-CoA:carnitine CoA-transferase CaiB-like acyl-CoA transferase
MRPLDGVRVLDLTRLVPGAYATLLLSDLGADVVKIEDPRGGDHARLMSPSFALLNRNKRSVTLDLRSPQAAEVLDAMARKSDVVVDSFRPRTARRLGVDAGTLRARHPRLICASITGFGRSGPYVDHAAHDINYQALAGLLQSRDGTVTGPGALVGDIGAAMQCAIGILAALIQRGSTGEGASVEISIHEAALAWSMFPWSADLVSACYNLYETADGRWLALGALEGKFWKAFCEALGRPDLVPLHLAQGPARERLMSEVRELMRACTREEWLARFAGVDACLTPVSTPDEALSDPHLAARQLVRRSGDAEAGVTYITPPGVDVRPAPALGAHTDDILEEAGIGENERARLRAAGVL